jgi:hypothetical protein
MKQKVRKVLLPAIQEIRVSSDELKSSAIREVGEEILEGLGPATCVWKYLAGPLKDQVCGLPIIQGRHFCHKHVGKGEKKLREQQERKENKERKRQLKRMMKERRKKGTDVVEVQPTGGTRSNPSTPSKVNVKSAFENKSRMEDIGHKTLKFFAETPSSSTAERPTQAKKKRKVINVDGTEEGEQQLEKVDKAERLAKKLQERDQELKCLKEESTKKLAEQEHLFEERRKDFQRQMEEKLLQQQRMFGVEIKKLVAHQSQLSQNTPVVPSSVFQPQPAPSVPLADQVPPVDSIQALLNEIDTEFTAPTQLTPNFGALTITGTPNPENDQEMPDAQGGEVVIDVCGEKTHEKGDKTG